MNSNKHILMLLYVRIVFNYNACNISDTKSTHGNFNNDQLSYSPDLLHVWYFLKHNVWLHRNQFVDNYYFFT